MRIELHCVLQTSRMPVANDTRAQTACVSGSGCTAGMFTRDLT
jgi:hypothetical protein